jgi:Peptidase M1 N-terminal domain
MLRIAILSFFSILCLTDGHLTASEKWPWLYNGILVENFANLSTKQGVSYRLPNDTFPHRYDIVLSTRIDLGIFEYSGTVTILLEAKTATSVITVHSKMLAIERVVLRNAITQTTMPTIYRLDELLEFLEITTESSLVVGQNYILEISYNGVLRSDYGGFYRSNYVNDVGTTK